MEAVHSLFQITVKKKMYIPVYDEDEKSEWSRYNSSQITVAKLRKSSLHQFLVNGFSFDVVK